MSASTMMLYFTIVYAITQYTVSVGQSESLCSLGCVQTLQSGYPELKNQQIVYKKAPDGEEYAQMRGGNQERKHHTVFASIINKIQDKTKNYMFQLPVQFFYCC